MEIYNFINSNIIFLFTDDDTKFSLNKISIYVVKYIEYHLILIEENIKIFIFLILVYL